MRDEDFVMGYAVGFNDGAQSGGSGGGLDDYPVFQNKKFRVGDSNFYFMVGDINTGFYDHIISFDEYTRRNSDGEIILRKHDLNCMSYDAALCVIVEKNGKRFLAVNISSISRKYKTKTYNADIGIDKIGSTVHYLDSVSFIKRGNYSNYAKYWYWAYDLNYEYHYITEDSSGYYSESQSSDSRCVIQGIEFEEDGSTIRRLPRGIMRSGCEITCYDESSYMELMDLMITLPDIIEEV